MPDPVSFRYFKTNPEIIQLAVMLYVRFPLSLRNVEDLLHCLAPISEPLIFVFSNKVSGAGGRIPSA